MRVALITSHFPPEVVGGTERVVLCLARALAAGGDDVLVVCAAADAAAGTGIDRETVGGVPVVRIGRRPEEARADRFERPRLVAAVVEAVAGHGAEVAHAHGLMAFGFGVLPALRARGVGTVLTVHDLWLACPRQFRTPIPGVVCPAGREREPCVACLAPETGYDEGVLGGLLGQRDARVSAELAAAGVLTAPSRYAAAALTRHAAVPAGMPEVEVVPHGLLDAPEGGPRPPAAPHGPFRIGTFGNLVRAKGVLELARAVAGLPVELHLAGRWLEEGLAGAVRAAAGGVPVVDHGPWDAGGPHPAGVLDLAVFPSRCAETYGLVVDEALARGVPAVVSDRGAFAERAGTPGVRVVADEELPGRLRSLVEEPAAYRALREEVPARLPRMEEVAPAYRLLYDRARAAAHRA